MSIISRLAFFFLLIAISLPLALATSIPSRSCKQNEFWYEAKHSCLPHGGPSTVPEPPKGQECPPTGYYWGKRQGCCIPKHPLPENSPPPQCRKGWQWFPYLHMCLPSPTAPSPPKPHPSSIHGPHDHHDSHSPNHGHKDDLNKNGYPSGQKGHGQTSHRHPRRSLQRSLPLCPTGLDACPLAGHGTGDYECVDTATELRSCGGCPSLGQGQDCTAIPGAFNVGCELGSCAVYTCSAGFRRAADGKSCIRI